MKRSGSLNEFGNKPITRRRSPVDLVKSWSAPEVPQQGNPGIDFTPTNVQWSLGGSRAFVATGKTQLSLPSGMYGLGQDNYNRILFNFLPINIDDLLEFPNSPMANILTEIDGFWQRGTAFQHYGFLHRRGYLFYGPAGSGKSSLVQQIVANIVKRGGLVLYCAVSPALISAALKILREVEPQRHIVCLFEDLDALLAEYSEGSILALLDGENQIDHVLNIATTNYPERLDRRIVARPRRFDRVIKIDFPTGAMRESFLQKKLKLSEDDLGPWVQATKGFSFAALAELVISVKCLGNDFDGTVRQLQDLITKKRSSSDYEEHSMGFGS